MSKVRPETSPFPYIRTLKRICDIGTFYGAVLRHGTSWPTAIRGGFCNVGTDFTNYDCAFRLDYKTSSRAVLLD
jgi:hypothetical protein